MPQIFIPPRYAGTPLYLPDITHGTKVAALAVGNQLGVASRANLVAIKDRLANGVETWTGIMEIWKWIVDDVKANGRQGKAVICATTCGSLAIRVLGRANCYCVDSYAISERYPSQ